MMILLKYLVAYILDSMAHEFEELVLDEQKYPTWVLDVKISLTFYGILATFSPRVEREETFLNTYKY
jgi:hypothetical protein